MSSLPPSPPPGFYDDPAGGRRWWDGTQWTEHREAPPTPALAPVGERRRNPVVIGCLGVVGIVFFAVVALLIGSAIGGGSSDSAGSVDMGTSATIAQNDCHDQVTAKLGSSGLAYSSEDTVADHNGKGPAIIVSGTVAQNGTQYFFQCSATAVAGGDVKAVRLITFTAK